MNVSSSKKPLDVESAVRERYSKGAQAAEPALCCPIDYEPRYLEVIPREVLERDYGCGDPSRYVREGDTVLDLGSGGGKICFIASQIAGPKGRVIGVDMNDDMLELARSNAPVVAEAIGYANTEFNRGKIQDLALSLDRVEAWLREHPVRDALGLSALEDHCELLRHESPMIPDHSIDLVVSNCVLNLVRDSDKSKLIAEIHRVLRPGGRIALSDIVSDEEIPQHLRDDPTLWSGCISGAFQEAELLYELEKAGFFGVEIDKWGEEPWQTVEGIEFRSVTITAKKGVESPCYEANQAVIYRGPFKQVEDDDGHVLRRGERVAVCDKTFKLLTSEPYAQAILPVEPRIPIPEGERKLFDCSRTTPRHPRETKGEAYDATTEASSCCSADSGDGGC